MWLFNKHSHGIFSSLTLIIDIVSYLECALWSQDNRISRALKSTVCNYRGQACLQCVTTGCQSCLVTSITFNLCRMNAQRIGLRSNIGKRQVVAVIRQGRLWISGEVMTPLILWLWSVSLCADETGDWAVGRVSSDDTCQACLVFWYSHHDRFLRNVEIHCDFSLSPHNDKNTGEKHVSSYKFLNFL